MDAVFPLSALFVALVLLGAWHLARQKSAAWILCESVDVPCACCKICKRVFPLPMRVSLAASDEEIQQEVRCMACNGDRWMFMFFRPVHPIWQRLLGHRPMLPTGEAFAPEEIGIPVCVPVQADYYYNPNAPMGEA